MNTEIRNTLIINHMHIVPAIVRQYYIPSLWYEDILQEGFLALTIAANHYDPSRGVTFPSYAAWWVRKYTLEALRSYGQIVRLPRHELPEHIYTEELSKVVRVEDDEALTYEDILPSDSTADATLLETERQRDFASRLSLLSPREQEVLGLMYGLDGDTPLPVREIAPRLGLSVDRVRKISQKSIKKMQNR